MSFITTKQASEIWNISVRRIRALCSSGRIDGATLLGKTWYIPENATKPQDARVKNIDKKKIYFGKLDRLKEKIDNSRPLTAGEVERLNEEFAINFTYDSNAIEGNTLSLQETTMVLQGITIDKKPLKDHMEAIGHKQAFDYICDIVKKDVEITESLIKKIHSLVLIDKPEDKGVYRRANVRINGSSHVPPEAFLVPNQMEDFFIKRKLWNKKHIIEKIALSHLYFESIHPFIDGNGRTGRLILNLELMKNGFPPINIKYLDAKRYFNAFEKFHDNNDCKPMINLIKEYVIERIQEYIKVIN